MIQITIDLGGVQRKLARMQGRLNNPSVVLQSIGSMAVASTALRFKDSKDPDGKDWSPLSRATINRRRAGSSKPLLDTGRLRSSITYVVEGNMVSIGTNVEYAATHQFGAKRGQYGSYDTRRRKNVPIPWGDVPARPFLGISLQDEIALIALVKKSLDL